MSSVIYNKSDKVQLYADLHRLTARLVPGVTLEMVEDALFRLCRGNGYDRASLALKLHWTLSSDYFTMSPTPQYLERVREAAAIQVKKESIAEAPLRDYWTK